MFQEIHFKKFISRKQTIKILYQTEHFTALIEEHQYNISDLIIQPKFKKDPNKNLKQDSTKSDQKTKLYYCFYKNKQKRLNKCTTNIKPFYVLMILKFILNQNFGKKAL